MKTFNALRELAKSNKYQILYARSKEYNGIKFFANEIDFTPIQIAFLQWLEVYHSLEMDLAMKEKYISRDVINDNYRVDAYLYCKDHKDKLKKDKKEPKEGFEVPSDIPSVVFKRG